MSSRTENLRDLMLLVSSGNVVCVLLNQDLIKQCWTYSADGVLELGNKPTVQGRHHMQPASGNIDIGSCVYNTGLYVFVIIFNP